MVYMYIATYVCITTNHTTNRVLLGLRVVAHSNQIQLHCTNMRYLKLLKSTSFSCVIGTRRILLPQEQCLSSPFPVD